MINVQFHQVLTFCVAAVWLVNGLVCKVLDFVPRHERIVARILGSEYSRPLTVFIGLSEIGMALWIVSRIKPRLNAIAQIVIVATMNTLEFILVPDLLLWGRLNSLFALLFILVVYYHALYLNRKMAK